MHQRLGQPLRAVAEYGAAIGIDATNTDAFVNRGLLNLGLGRFDPAIADLTRADTLRPHDATVLANRGLAYAWKNDAVRATRDFATVHRSDPGNITVLHGESILAMAHGDTASAIGLLGQAIARSPTDEWALAGRVELYRGTGNTAGLPADLTTLRELRRPGT